MGEGEPCQPGDPMFPCILGEARIAPGVEGPEVPREEELDPKGLPAAPASAPAPAAAARFGHDDA